MQYRQIPKRARNAIEARLKATVRIYGFSTFQTIANRYIKKNVEKQRIQDEILQKEKELEKLKRTV